MGAWTLDICCPLPRHCLESRKHNPIAEAEPHLNIRQAFIETMLDELVTDCRYSIRRLTRSRGFSAFAVMGLALTIGANTTVFSLLNATSLRKIAVADPDSLVSLSAVDAKNGRPGFIYGPTFEAFRDAQSSFSHLSMYQSPFLLRGEVRGGVADFPIEGVTGGYFDLVGVDMIAGRGLLNTDDTATPGQLAAVISASLWHDLFGGDVRAIGEVITIEKKPLTIVGVASSTFHGISGDTAIDLWVPVAVARALTSDVAGPVRSPHMVARLVAGVTLNQAQSEVLARWRSIQDSSVASLPPAVQEAVKSQTVTVGSAARGFSLLRTQYERPVIALFVLTAVFLAIGMVNLIGLMVTKALAERLETAMKFALGVSRARLLSQAAIEGLLIALLALAGAIPIVWWLCNALTSAVSQTRSMPLEPPLTPDGGIIAVAVILAVAIGFVVAVVPAWRAANDAHNDVIRGGRSIGGRLNRSGKTVIVVQVALSLVLLIGGTLFARTFEELESNQARFRDQDVLFTRLPRIPGDRTRLQGQYFHDLVNELSTIANVKAAALSSTFPGYFGLKGPVPTDLYSGRASSERDSMPALTEFVSPGFFTAFDIAALRGRDFTWNDDERTPAVAIINQHLAERLFRSVDVIGEHIVVNAGPARTQLEVVGVVSNATIGSVREPDLGVVFRPIVQNLARAQVPIAHVRFEGDLASVRSAYAAKVEAQRHHYVRSLFTLDQWMDNALIQERLLYTVTMSIAGVAMVLACLGIYAALAYSVTVRLREMAIRIAIGATPSSVLRLIVFEGLTIVATGVLIGVPSALAVATLTRSQLFGVGVTDPLVVTACGIGFLLASFVAVISPAWRASKTDPAETLRRA